MMRADLHVCEVVKESAFDYRVLALRVGLVWDDVSFGFGIVDETRWGCTVLSFERIGHFANDCRVFLHSRPSIVYKQSEDTILNVFIR